MNNKSYTNSNALPVTLPKALRDWIDQERDFRSRSAYIIKCIDYIKTHNISINEHYEDSNNDRDKESPSN